MEPASKTSAPTRYLHDRCGIAFELLLRALLHSICCCVPSPPSPGTAQGFNAAAGWDATTGWGTPNVANLAQLLLNTAVPSRFAWGPDVSSLQGERMMLDFGFILTVFDQAQ